MLLYYVRSKNRNFNGEKAMKVIRVFVFVIGIVLIAIGAYGLLTQSTWSNVVNSLFTIFGFAISFAQLFLHFPLLAFTTASSGSSTSSSYITSVSGAARTYRGSALVIFLSSLIFGYVGFFTLSNSNQSLSLITLVLVADILLLCGLPGFYMKQAYSASWFGGISIVIVVAAAIINILVSAIYIMNFNPGYPIPSSIFALSQINSYFVIAGNISLGISMIYAQIYPKWTGVAMLITGCAGIILLLHPPLNISNTIIGLWDMILAFLYIRCTFILFL